jgi:hypothetical protein
MAKKCRKATGNKKGRRSFSPDAVATQLHLAICTDLEAAPQEHCGLASVSPFWASVQQIQSDCFLSKYQSERTSKEKLELEAFEKFLKVNQYLSRVDRKANFPYGINRDSRKLSKRMRVHLKARSLVHWVLGELNEDEWFEHCHHGSGSTVGVPFMDTSVTAKMRPPLTCTLGARTLFSRYLEWDFQAHEVLTEDHQELFSVVEGSAAMTVDKTSEKRRMIAPEPTANMFLQLGLMDVLYARLRQVGLDVTKLQEKHRELAWVNSITRECATIDWSSASDSVGIELLRWLLPPRWFNVLDNVRCRKMYVNGALTTLHMFSTMGNACTFPLETLVFWAYAQACGSLLRDEHTLLWGSDSLDPRVSVYGDDCIVPEEMVDLYVTILEGVGFTVNPSKTHSGSSDAFRESCGRDCLTGIDVRPFYIGAPTGRKVSDLESWLYIVINALQSRYISYFGRRDWVYDRKLFHVIFDLFREYGIKPKLVPPDYPDDSGIRDVDGVRLAANYRVAFSPLAITQAGWVKFPFKRYVYGRKLPENPRVGLWVNHKFPAHLTFLERLFGWKQPKQLEYPQKKGGGYVVASGLASLWLVSLGEG